MLIELNINDNVPAGAYDLSRPGYLNLKHQAWIPDLVSQALSSTRGQWVTSQNQAAVVQGGHVSPGSLQL